MNILSEINYPADIKKLNIEQLRQLAKELRSYLTDSLLKTGGHLASNLGVVELTIALLYVYDFPQDKLIWDVGHQSCVYKILTGRKNKLSSLRKTDGISSFPLNEESRYDVFNTGHSSTSISAGLGMALARDLDRGTNHIISVIGDGALTGGMAWEALNDLGSKKIKMLVILNDNDMSISKNVGAVSKHLAKARLNPKYTKLKIKLGKFIKSIPFFGKPLYRCVKAARNNMKLALIKGKLFEQMGVKYLGPVDGHDIKLLIDLLETAKDYSRPLLLHIVTKKGKGCEFTESDPVFFHGISPSKTTPPSSFSTEFGLCLTQLAQRDTRITAITAAMTEGTGLKPFSDAFPRRFFDVGIAEQHAVTLAAGLASAGKKPYFAVYSTFLQRGYDQVLHDVCLQDLPVTFCIDRAGLSGNDGVTHQGLYDIAYLSAMPNMTIYAPADIYDLQSILTWSLTFHHPLAIRYPKDCQFNNPIHEKVVYGKWQQYSNQHDNIIFAYGDRMLKLAFVAVETHALQADIVNACFPNIPDEGILFHAQGKNCIILEDHIQKGGLYDLLAQYYATHNTLSTPQLSSISFPNEIIEHGSPQDLFRKHRFSLDQIKTLIVNK